MLTLNKAPKSLDLTLGRKLCFKKYLAKTALKLKDLHKLNIQLNNTMKMTAGPMKSTPLHWLPIHLLIS